jgi:FtsH-binding integral membrane protein
MGNAPVRRRRFLLLFLALATIAGLAWVCFNPYMSFRAREITFAVFFALLLVAIAVLFWIAVEPPWP